MPDGRVRVSGWEGKGVRLYVHLVSWKAQVVGASIGMEFDIDFSRLFLHQYKYDPQCFWVDRPSCLTVKAIVVKPGAIPSAHVLTRRKTQRRLVCSPVWTRFSHFPRLTSQWLPGKRRPHHIRKDIGDDEFELRMCLLQHFPHSH